MGNRGIKSFGKRLEQERLDNGFTRPSLGSKSSMSKTSIYLIERKGGLPLAFSLYLLCINLNVRADYLMGLIYSDKKDDFHLKRDIDNLYMLHKRLKKARLERGLSQKQLADLTGIRHEVICRYEKGLFLPGTKNIFLICRNLKISADYLIGLRRFMER